MLTVNNFGPFSDKPIYKSSYLTVPTQAIVGIRKLIKVSMSKIISIYIIIYKHIKRYACERPFWVPFQQFSSNNDSLQYICTDKSGML